MTPNERGAFSLDQIEAQPAIADRQLGSGGEGALHIAGFLSPESYDWVQREVAEVPFTDAHREYENVRGLHIIQNHDLYALKRGIGDQQPFDRLTASLTTMYRIRKLVHRLGSPALPGAVKWAPNELSFHRYDVQELGLSFHRDNLRYLGVVAIYSIEGSCEFWTRMDEFDDEPVKHSMLPNDLMLLRASRLLPPPQIDLCPDHMVGKLITPTRTTMMVRQNSRPSEPVEGFDFTNWPQAK